MANPIRQSITLDGAREVQRQFSDLADAGSRAFQSIKASAQNTSAGNPLRQMFGDVRTGISQILSDAGAHGRPYAGNGRDGDASPRSGRAGMKARKVERGSERQVAECMRVN
jgi:hypothetical protein